MRTEPYPEPPEAVAERVAADDMGHSLQTGTPVNHASVDALMTEAMAYGIGRVELAMANGEPFHQVEDELDAAQDWEAERKRVARKLGYIEIRMTRIHEFIADIREILRIKP